MSIVAPHPAALSPAPKPEPALIIPALRAWIRRQTCAVQGCIGQPIVAAHARTRRNNGDVANLLPLCHDHHQAQHNLGDESFCHVVGWPEDGLVKQALRYWTVWTAGVDWTAPDAWDYAP